MAVRYGRLKLDGDDGADALLRGEPDALLGQDRQQFVRGQHVAVDLEREADQGERLAIQPLPNLTAAGHLVIRHNDLLDNDGRIRQERGAEGALQASQPCLDLPF